MEVIGEYFCLAPILGESVQSLMHTMSAIEIWVAILNQVHNVCLAPSFLGFLFVYLFLFGCSFCLFGCVVGWFGLVI